MRQRAIIAIALALVPEIIIMDEPTTALDVVVQREILMEIVGLRERFGFSVIFITHDLSLLLELADKMAIMYAGAYRRDWPPRRTEAAATPSLQLWHAALVPDDPWPAAPHDWHSWLATRSARAVPTGCAFHPRCPHGVRAMRSLLCRRCAVPAARRLNNSSRAISTIPRYVSGPLPTNAEFAASYEEV